MTAMLLAITFVLLVAVSLLLPAHAQTGAMRTSTSGGTLDVLLEPSPLPIENKDQTQFKVTFLERGTDNVQVHVDYDIIIVSEDGREVYRASNESVQNAVIGKPLHTTTGIVTLETKFANLGDYTVKVPVEGVNFIPITPESAEFSITVTPEFPTGVAMVVAAIVVSLTVVMRRFGKDRSRSYRLP